MFLKKRKTLSFIIIAMIVLSLTLAGCGQAAAPSGDTANNSNVDNGTAAKDNSQPVDGGNFRFGMISSPSSLDPAFLEENNGIEIGKELNDGLVKYNNETLAVEPAIAEKWDISPDNTVYTFHIRKGVKFHDGSEVKADDVIASWTRLALKDTASPLADLLMAPIKGFKEINQDGTTKEFSGLKKIDDYTVQVTLDKPNAAFLTSIGHPAASIYKVSAAEKEGKDFGTPSTKAEDYIGAGPFKFVEWSADDHVTIAKFNDYYGNKAHVDSVTYRIFKDENTALNEFKAGNLDFVDMLPLGQRQAIIAQYPGQTDKITALVTQYLGFNMTKPPFKDNPDFRKAIAYAIDPQTIIDTLMEGISTVANGPLPQGMPGYDKDLKAPTYDPEKAKEYLKKAFPDGNVPTVRYSYNFNQGNQKIAEAIQGQLQEVGIPTKLENAEWASYIKQLQSGDSEMFRLAWGADYPDPDNFLYALYTSSQAGDNNDTFYSNSDVDSLLDKGRVETDPAKRNDVYKQIQEKLVEDQPAVWLFNSTYLHLHGKNVHGLAISALDQKDMTTCWLSE